jgi:uncharacterized membrane protein
LVVVAAAVLMGIFFRFYHLDRKVFWDDEVVGSLHMLGHTEAEVVRSSPTLKVASDVQRFTLTPAGTALRLDDTIRALREEDPHIPPLFYLSERLWTSLFGTSVAAIRSLSALFGVLVLPCVYWLAIELFGSSIVAIVSLGLIAVSPIYVLYSQEGREYSMWTLAFVLVSASFLRAVRLNVFAGWLLYTVITGAACYVNPLTGFVVLGSGVYLFVREHARLTPVFRNYAIAVVGAVLCFSPWLVVMVTSPVLGHGMVGIATSKLTPVGIALIFLRDLRFPFFDIGLFRVGPVSSTAVHLTVTALVVGITIYAFVSLVRRRPYATWGFIVLGLCVPLLALIPKGQFVIQARYFFPLLMGVQLAIAALLGAWLVKKPANTTPMRAILLFAVLMCGEVASDAVSSGADTWWNKDYQRSTAVADVINRTPKAIIVSDYDATSILALSRYVDPSTAVRLNVSCSLCTVRVMPRPSLTKAPDDATVFILGIPDGREGLRIRWIDPRPYPPKPDPLNLFLSV